MFDNQTRKARSRDSSISVIGEPYRTLNALSSLNYYLDDLVEYILVFLLVSRI
jgi:hypothetical protein